MQFLKLLRTVPKEVRWLAIIAMAVLLLKLLLFNKLPAPSHVIYDLGPVIDNILYSVLASCIFYFFVVHLKEESDRGIVLPYVYKQARRVVGICVSKLHNASTAAELLIPFRDADREKIKVIFGKLHPNGAVPNHTTLQGEPYKWLQSLVDDMDRTRHHSRNILAQMRFLDAELVGIMLRIEDCGHFLHLDSTRGILSFLGNTDLSSWADEFAAYCISVRELQDYLTRHAAASD